MQSKYFKIEELVPKEIFFKRGQKAWELINPKLIVALDKIKQQFPEGTMTVNNWLWGGIRNYSGLRTPDSSDYSTTSQHALGNAFDAVFSNYDVEEVRQYILANPTEFEEIKGIELDITWLHVDVRNSNKLKTFKG